MNRSAPGRLAEERRRGERRREDVILGITRQLMTITDLGELLRRIAEATTDLLDAERATIYLVDHERGELWSTVALGSEETIRIPLGVGIAGQVARTREAVNIADAYADPRFSPEVDRRSGFRTRNLLTLPMTGGTGEVSGVFQALNKRAGSFSAEDEAILHSLAASAAVAIENAQLVAGQRRLWQTLIETLARTIDARDQQTAGHSQRVTRYAELIGRALGMSGAAIEALRAGALLHDYGKIAVRDRFLRKPGKLDEAEFAYMKAHAEKTAEFLARLEFPAEMREVPLIAAQHHERIDGRGYPAGLSGDEIHPSARVVAVADVFDALTAPRYYKPAYSLEQTLGIMDAMSGTHLDTEVMVAFRAALPQLRRALDELRTTWPQPGDEGMGSLQEAVLSERDTPR